ncbi:hypothetical protein RHMOL_Rhmol08G0194300 [Rhododendron molle]|uniref:Uncharacterized protein n=1 Tax=Rhododendron molle TaxID=49168 RepID=A0ACC0MRE5_RHOML|nr:hypothetical protein RHMOL_Rhmol08G0194300 [Rhododendron molle]
MRWAIALHGGAGDIPLNLPPERREPREAALRHCLDIGVAALKHNKSPLDVVELVQWWPLELARRGIKSNFRPRKKQNPKFQAMTTGPTLI